MARKVILDVDPGIDDAVALCLALFDPRLEVVAVTATAGNVSAEQASCNVQTIIEQLDPPRWPRIGVAPKDGLTVGDGRHIHGEDGLGNANFPFVELIHQHSSDKVIWDELKAAPGEVTVIALGPLTNIAATLSRDPELATTIGHLVMMGGAWRAPGNVSAVAEFNIHANPSAARTIFRSPVTKTLVPLDVTSQLVMTYDQSDQMPDESTRVGAFLNRILPYAFRSHRNHCAMEGIYLHDAVALISVLHPELFQTESMIADVETTGQLTRGMTVFDQRPGIQRRPNMEVAVGVDVEAVMDAIVRGLNATP